MEPNIAPAHRRPGNPPITAAGLVSTLAVLAQMQAARLDPSAPKPDLPLLLVDAERGNLRSVALGEDRFGAFVAVTVRKPGPGNQETSTFLLDAPVFLALRLILAAGESIFLNPSSPKRTPLADQKFYLRLLSAINFTVLRLVADPRADQEVGEAAHDWHDLRRGWLGTKPAAARKSRGQDLRTRDDAIRAVRERITAKQAKGTYHLALDGEAIERAIRVALRLVDEVPLGAYLGVTARAAE